MKKQKKSQRNRNKESTLIDVVSTPKKPPREWPEFTVPFFEQKTNIGCLPACVNMLFGFDVGVPVFRDCKSDTEQYIKTNDWLIKNGHKSVIAFASILSEKQLKDELLCSYNIHHPFMLGVSWPHLPDDEWGHLIVIDSVREILYDPMGAEYTVNGNENIVKLFGKNEKYAPNKSTNLIDKTIDFTFKRFILSRLPYNKASEETPDA